VEYKVLRLKQDAPIAVSGEDKKGTALHIIVTGCSKAGKTSLIQCITNAGDKPVTIDVDARTVEIEIVDWEPTAFEVDGQHVEPHGLRCRFLDLAGQTVYANSNQLVLIPRALYIIVWRVRPSMRKSDADEMATALCPTFLEQECMIVDCMASLQARVPGVSGSLSRLTLTVLKEGVFHPSTRQKK